MNVDEYVAWETEQELKHELVDGTPQMRVETSLAHDTVKMNTSFFLKGQLKGSRCHVLSSDMKIRCRNDNIRYPDITVACGTMEPESLFSVDPRIVFEVLSPSTRTTDFLIKLRDYKTVPSLTSYVILWQDEPRALIYRKKGEAWIEEEVQGDAGVIELPEIDIKLPLAEAYDGLPKPKPRSRSRK